MKTQHTPGPWSAFNHSWCETSIIAQGFDHGICSLDINHATEESQEADEAQMAANARLIAAAPELLQLVIDLSNWLEDIPINYLKHHNHAFKLLDDAKETIAKATGEQP
jgi:hypothetical protein